MRITVHETPQMRCLAAAPDFFGKSFSMDSGAFVVKNKTK